MMEQRGRIILTSSWVGSIPWPDITPYTVSKAGVNMLVKQMARELAVHRISSKRRRARHRRSGFGGDVNCVKNLNTPHAWPR